MNINNIKKEFPIFDEKIQNNDLVYLDSANSSQKPKIVLDRINAAEIQLVSRKASAAPAVGLNKLHNQQQEALVIEALTS